MGSIIAILVFGSGFALAIWTIAATVRPQLSRIMSLLTDGVTADVPALPPILPARERVTARAPAPATVAYRRAVA